MTLQSKTKGTKGNNKPGCALISATDSINSSRQGLDYFAGISAESAGSRGICMHLVNIPPGGSAKAHMHESHETAIYILSGECEVLYGEGLQERLTGHTGDFIYIPENMPHLPVNRSETEPCKALISRTDPHEQESVVLLPALDELV